MNKYSLRLVLYLLSFKLIAHPFFPSCARQKKRSHYIFSYSFILEAIQEVIFSLHFKSSGPAFSKPVFSSTLLHLAKEASEKLTLHVKCIETLRLSLSEFWVVLLLAWAGWKTSEIDEV